MATNVLIKNNKQKPVTVEDVAKLNGLSYGVSDGNFILDWGKTGTYTILFDEREIGRGFELNFTEFGMEFNQPLPATTTDIENFYTTIEKAAELIGSYDFCRDGEVYPIGQISQFIEWDKAFSESALKKFHKEMESGKKETFIVYAALNPITISLEDARYINGSPENYRNFLNEKQQKDVFYAGPKLYQRPNEEIFALYFVGEATDTVIPLKPSFISDTVTVKDYYVMIPGHNAIPHSDFIANITPEEYYDSDHIVVSLKYEEINPLAEKFAYNCDIHERCEANRYYSRRRLDHHNWHTHKIAKLKLKCDKDAGYNHLAVFLKWSCLNDILDEHMYQCIPDLKMLCEGGIADIRELLKNSRFLNGELLLGYFKEEYHGFVTDFYRFNCDRGYPDKVDRVSEEYFGTKKYNSKAFKDEAYLFTPFDEEYYKNLSAFIDEAWEAYKNK